MKYTKEELGFILYNNRSVNGVVSNFIPKINPIKLIRIEKLFSESKKLYSNDSRMVEIHLNEIDVECDDIIVTKNELSSLTNLFIKNKGNLNQDEYDYLIKRGCGSLIDKYQLFGLSSITNKKHLEIIGATCHPTLKNILIDGIENGGIVIPLYQEGILVNCAIRKIAIENSDKKSLKYSLACPDIPVWGLDDIERGDEIWITEGLFDMMAIQQQGKKCLSCSSAMWSGIQLYKLLSKKPSKINIFSDNDQVGLRTSAILKDFFNKNNIDCVIYISDISKDASEHFLQKDLNWSSVKQIDIDDDLINNNIDDSFDFINHIKNRRY
jgi:hypothetical protein